MRKDEIVDSIECQPHMARSLAWSLKAAQSPIDVMRSLNLLAHPGLLPLRDGVESLQQVPQHIANRLVYRLDYETTFAEIPD